MTGASDRQDDSEFIKRITAVLHFVYNARTGSQYERVGNKRSGTAFHLRDTIGGMSTGKHLNLIVGTVRHR